MSLDCFSEATIVRCPSLTGTQNGIIFAPTVIQVLAVIGVTALYWRAGKRKHYFLLVESCAYYALTLLDLLSHLIPQARTSLNYFKTFDIVIGSLSFVPILFYSVFLYIIVRTFLLTSLSRIPGKIVKYTLVAFVPFAIALNELSSFVGISYESGDSLSIGFAKSSDETAWQFFTSIMLAFLAVIQVKFVMLATFTGILESRGRLNTEDSDSRPTFRGVVWITIGAVLGATETLLGFADGRFEVVLTRRILRMFSRLALTMGTLACERASLSGPSQSVRRPRRISEIRKMISNPRTSTFAHLNTDGYYTLGAGSGKGKERDPELGLPANSNTGSPFEGLRAQRVTVEFDARSGKSPRLALHLPKFEVPPAEVLTERFNRRGTIFGAPSRSTLGDLSSSRSTSGNISLPQSLLARARAASGASGGELPAELRAVRSSSGARVRARSNTYDSARPNPRFRLQSIGSTFMMQSIRSSGTGDSDSVAAPNARMFTGSTPRHERLLSESSLASDSFSVARSVGSDFLFSQRRTPRAGDFGAEGAELPWLSEVEEGTESAMQDTRSDSAPRKSSSIKRKPPPSLAGNVGADVTISVSSTEALPSPRASRSRDTFGQKRSNGSLRRKQMPIPPPINAALASEDYDARALAAEVQITQSPSIATSIGPSEARTSSMFSSVPRNMAPAGRTQNAYRAETPGMTTSVTATSASSDAPTAYMPPQQARMMKGLDSDYDSNHKEDRDPFRDSMDTRTTFTATTDDEGPDYEYDVAVLESAESGLGRMAKRVRDFDHLRRRSFRGGEDSPAQTSPVKTPKARTRHTANPTDTEDPFAQSRPAISAPRPLSSKRSRANSQGARGTPSAWNADALPGANKASGTPPRPGIVRIKSVGRVATRRTPTPSSSTRSFIRRSMRIDSTEFSEAETSMLSESASDGEDAWIHSVGRSAGRAYYGRERGALAATVMTPDSVSVFSPSASGLSTPTAVSTSARSGEGSSRQEYTYTIQRAVRQRTL